MLELKNVSLQYNGKVIFDNLNYKFENGRIYVIRGESGRGKTTLLNVICGYVSDYSGEVSMEENDKIGYLYQDETLFSNLTVKENLFIKFVAVGKVGDFDSRCGEILESLHIGNLAERKVEMLSGGERQRVQLASMLFDEPNIILMDEPTSKLDVENTNTIKDVILTTFKEKTVIVVTHEDVDYGENSVNLKLENGGVTVEEK